MIHDIRKKIKRKCASPISKIKGANPMFCNKHQGCTDIASSKEWPNIEIIAKNKLSKRKLLKNKLPKRESLKRVSPKRELPDNKLLKKDILTKDSVKNTLVSELFDEVWNKKKVKKIAKIFSHHFILHAGDQIVKGRKAFQKQVQDWLIAFPDLHYELEDVIFADDTAIARWRGTGTHLGIFMGMLPTKRKIDYHGITILKVKDDQFVEGWVVGDSYKLISSLKTFSTKKYGKDDFCADFNGPARKIYQWIMNARPEPSCKQKLANAIRETFSVAPIDDKPKMTFSPDIMNKIEMRELVIRVDNDRHVRNLVFIPQHKKEELLPVVIYMHGGGWTIEGPDESELLTRKLAHTSHVVVISVDYSLAPEYPFPNGLEDCLSVYRWVRDRGQKELSIDPTRVAVGGDSSGGNLALALALKTRKEGRMPEGVLALCPSTDFVMEKYDSLQRFGPKGLLYDYAFYSFVRSIYAPSKNWTDPLVSPMYANLKNFCPVCMIVAGQDLLLDENRAFYKKLLAAGNTQSEYFLFPEMPHAFYYFLGLTKDEEQCYQAMTRFLNRIFNR